MLHLNTLSGTKSRIIILKSTPVTVTFINGALKICELDSWFVTANNA